MENILERPPIDHNNCHPLNSNNVYCTNKSSAGSNILSTAARIIADLPNDRPRVSELIKFYELLIKGQLEEYLPLHDTEAIRKIRNAVNDREGMSLLIRAFEDNSSLLQEMRTAIKQKGIEQIMLTPIMITL